ncbi:fibronectin type III domain-containing protein [Pseudaquabacterium inlustre]
MVQPARSGRLGSALLFAAALTPIAMLHTTVHAASALPALVLDKTQTTVSGLSSGGFMAVQLHVAYSATFAKGAGVVAGGPFYCAEGSVTNATGRCMAHNTSIPVATLVSTTKSWATSGYIDPVANLQNSKVYLYSGTSDNTVKQAVMNDLQTYYASFVPSANVVYKNNIASGHAMITDDTGSSCATTASPYINNCGFDLAGAMLQQLYGTLNARNNGTLGGSFIEYDQTAFITGHGMATTGWAYVPAACSTGSTCKLHVVLHGCKQNTADIGTQYVKNTGYNRWADTNKIVMLYPQTGTGATNSCWDWWGYDNANYSKKSGPQMAAVKAMVDKLGSGTPPANLAAPTGVATSGATASSLVVSWGSVSGAAGYNVYRAATKANATLVAGTSYTDTGLASGTTYSYTVRAVDANGAEGPASATATGTTTGTAAVCFTASNYAHTTAGRAYQSGGNTFANGSNQAMGLWNTFTTTTLKQTGPNYYVIGTCP